MQTDRFTDKNFDDMSAKEMLQNECHLHLFLFLFFCAPFRSVLFPCSLKRFLFPCSLVEIVRVALFPNTPGRPSLLHLFSQASEFRETEWEAEGLFQPKPRYADGKNLNLSWIPVFQNFTIPRAI